MLAPLVVVDDDDAKIGGGDDDGDDDNDAKADDAHGGMTMMMVNEDDVDDDHAMVVINDDDNDDGGYDDDDVVKRMIMRNDDELTPRWREFLCKEVSRNCGHTFLNTCCVCSSDFSSPPVPTAENLSVQDYRFSSVMKLERLGFKTCTQLRSSSQDLDFAWCFISLMRNLNSSLITQLREESCLSRFATVGCIISRGMILWRCCVGAVAANSFLCREELRQQIWKSSRPHCSVQVARYVFTIGHGSLGK